MANLARGINKMSDELERGQLGCDNKVALWVMKALGFDKQDKCME